MQNGSSFPSSMFSQWADTVPGMQTRDTRASRRTQSFGPGGDKATLEGQIVPHLDSTQPFLSGTWNPGFHACSLHNVKNPNRQTLKRQLHVTCLMLLSLLVPWKHEFSLHYHKVLPLPQKHILHSCFSCLANHQAPQKPLKTHKQTSIKSGQHSKRRCCTRMLTWSWCRNQFGCYSHDSLRIWLSRVFYSISFYIHHVVFPTSHLHE